MDESKSLANLSRKISTEFIDVIAKKAKISDVKIDIEITGVPLDKDEQPWKTHHRVHYHRPGLKR